MVWRKVFLAVVATTVVATSLAPAEATARSRSRAYMTPDQYDRYCGRLPAYGFDGCGYREFGYGQECWRRVIVRTADGPRARRTWTCGYESGIPG
jgi:hypothetical protein